VLLIPSSKFVKAPKIRVIRIIKIILKNWNRYGIQYASDIFKKQCQKIPDHIFANALNKKRNIFQRFKKKGIITFDLIDNERPLNNAGKIYTAVFCF